MNPSLHPHYYAHLTSSKYRSSQSTSLSKTLSYFIPIYLPYYHPSPTLKNLPYLLQPLTSRRTSLPCNNPIITPSCTTPLQSPIARLDMCSIHPLGGMYQILRSCMCRGGCVVMGGAVVIVDCSSSSSRTVHCVGRAGTVCFGGGVVSCGEEGVSVPILVYLMFE